MGAGKKFAAAKFYRDGFCPGLRKKGNLWCPCRRSEKEVIKIIIRSLQRVSFSTVMNVDFFFPWSRKMRAASGQDKRQGIALVTLQILQYAGDIFGRYRRAYPGRLRCIYRRDFLHLRKAHRSVILTERLFLPVNIIMQAVAKNPPVL